MNELKECPFCKGKAAFVKAASIYSLTEDIHYVAVVCTNEKCLVQPESPFYPTEEEAMKAWNTRGKEPKWLYRLESADPRNGLWYNTDGEFCWGIAEVPGCRTKDLPMDYDERYKKDGRNWFSSCSDAADLPHWYSVEDVKHLFALGFVFKKYLATEYVEYELETTFIKESCLDEVELSLDEVMKIMNGELPQ